MAASARSTISNGHDLGQLTQVAGTEHASRYRDLPGDTGPPTALLLIGSWPNRILDESFAIGGTDTSLDASNPDANYVPCQTSRGSG